MFKPRKVADFSFIVFCLVACLYQTFLVFQQYLTYEVTSNLDLKIPDPLPVPDLTICIRYTDIIDLETLKRRYNVSLTRGYTVCHIRKIQEVSTVEDILKLTPREDGLIGKCRVRQPRKYSPAEESGDLCMKFFTAAKFTTQEFVCYKFSVSSLGNGFDYGILTSSFIWPGLLYHITFKNFSWIQDVRVMKIAVHSKADLPYLSLGLGSVVGSQEDPNDFKHVTLTYTSVEGEALESPYQTDCRKRTGDGHKYSKQGCYTECIMAQTKEKFQRVPFSILIQDPLKSLEISSVQVSNHSFTNSLSDIELDCNSRCRESECVFDYTMTFPSYQKSDRLQFIVTTPNEPTLRIVFRARMNFNDLIYYVMSLFSFWFGISVLTFTPAPLLSRCYKLSSFEKKTLETSSPSFRSSSKFCSNTRRNLLRGMKEELDFLSGQIFLRK